MRCKASELKEIMSPAINLATGRSPLVPVLQGVMLSYDGEEEVVCTASDTTLFLESRGLLPPELLKEEKIGCVVYGDFYKIIEMLGDKDITVTQDKKKIKILAEDEDYTFPYTPAEEFVDVKPPTAAMVTEMTLPIKELGRILAAVQYSAQTKEYYGNTCMIEFRSKDGRTYFSTTREISLAIYSLDIDCGVESFLVPPDYLSIVNKGARQNGGSVTITLFPRMIKMETQGFIFWGLRASDDKFPDVMSVIAKTTDDARITITRGDMKRAIDKLYAIRPKYAPPVYLSTEGGSFIFGMEQTEDGSAAAIKLTAVLSGGEHRYRFNLLYLRDAFQSLSAEEVTMRLVRLGNGVKCLIVEDGYDERNVRLLAALHDGPPTEEEGKDEV